MAKGAPKVTGDEDMKKIQGWTTFLPAVFGAPRGAWWPTLAAGVLLLAAGLLLAPAVGQAQTTRRERAVNLGELKRLLEVARESGFSEEEIHKITIEDNGRLLKAARATGFSKEDVREVLSGGNERLIIVWRFLLLLEAKRKLDAERLKELKEKRYLTVQDFLSDLRKGEPKDLDALRREPEFNK